MGNWLTLEALRQMAIRNDGLPKKFKNVMLAAPDVDVDVFRSQIEDMGSQHPRFTLFVSRDDRALAFSRRVWATFPGLVRSTRRPIPTSRNWRTTRSRSSI